MDWRSDKNWKFIVFKTINNGRCPYLLWNSTDSYPGGTKNQIGLPEYDHNRFRAFYSDHHPVVFKLKVLQTDDDWPNGNEKSVNEVLILISALLKPPHFRITSLCNPVIFDGDKVLLMSCASWGYHFCFTLDFSD